MCFVKIHHIGSNESPDVTLIYQITIDNYIVNFEQISHLVLCFASAKKQLTLNIDRSLTVNFYTYREKFQCLEELIDLKIFLYSKVFLLSEVFCICDISI